MHNLVIKSHNMVFKAVGMVKIKIYLYFLLNLTKPYFYFQQKNVFFIQFNHKIVNITEG